MHPENPPQEGFAPPIRIGACARMPKARSRSATDLVVSRSAAKGGLVKTGNRGNDQIGRGDMRLAASFGENPPTFREKLRARRIIISYARRAAHGTTQRNTITETEAYEGVHDLASDFFKRSHQKK